MPISDILAQITGEKASQATITKPLVPRSLPAAERDVEIPQLSNRLPSHRSIHAPVRSVNAPTASTTQQALGDRRVNSSSSDLPRPFRTVASGRVTKHSTKFIRTRTAVAPGAKEPKKGSYAEILARAERVQASTGHVGKIQHRPVDRQVTQRGRPEVKSPPLPSEAATPNPRTVKNRAKSVTKLPAPNSHADRREPTTQGSRVRAEVKTIATQKVKKAAVATIGYTGTARPKSDPTSQTPGIATHNRTHLTSSRPRPLSNAGRPQRDEYDHDMDDFIDYDDDEENFNRRDDRGMTQYDSDSDHSSFMEADMHDIEEEERRAARIAVEEDRREEETERKLKHSKLVARRKALA